MEDPTDGPFHPRVRRQCRRLIEAFAAVSLLLAAVGGCVGLPFQSVQSSERQLTQRVEKGSSAQSVRIESRNGRIEVVRDPSATAMEIATTIRCGGRDPAEAEARVAATKLVVDAGEDGRVRIAVEFPDGSSRGSDSASIVVRAPAIDGVEAATSNGRIEVRGASGGARLATSNGSVEVDGHDGPVHVRTSNGPVRARAVTGPIDAATSNGRIEASLAPSAAGAVRFATSNGAIELDLGENWQGTVEASTSNGRIELDGKVSKGSGSMTVGDAGAARAVLATSNGRIVVRRTARSDVKPDEAR